MNILLNQITITGFGGYKDTVVYPLGYRTTISADNGLGKSSVRNAIVWCLTGCDAVGNERATTDLVNNNKPKITEVILDFELDGEVQTIIRRKKGSTTDIYWNEEKISNNDIAKEIYKNKNLFLSIFNPYYFPALAPKDAKQLLSDVLKPINREEIFNELGEYLKKLLLDNGFRLPETFLADTRQEIKEQEENIIFLEGKLDSLQVQEVQEEKIFDDTELNECIEELKKLNELSDLEYELSKITKPEDITSKIYELKIKENEEISLLNQSKEELKSLIDVCSKKEIKNKLLSEYKKKKEKIASMKEEVVVCKKCGNEIDVLQDVKLSLEKEIEEILIQGKELKKEIEAAEEENKNIAKINEKITNTFKAKNIEIQERYEDLRNKLSIEYEKALNNYTRARNEIIEKHKIMQEKNKDKLEFLNAKIQALQEQKKEIEEFNQKIKFTIDNNKEIEEERTVAEERIKNSKNKIAQLKLAIDAGKQYNSIKLKKQSEQINPYLDKVEIKFEKLTKDGELKDDFKINYNGKKFGIISASERIKAGLEIANLLINVQNLHLPIFVDDAESINVIPEIDTQIIQARVTTDKDIKVEINESK